MNILNMTFFVVFIRDLEFEIRYSRKDVTKKLGGIPEVFRKTVPSANMFLKIC